MVETRLVTAITLAAVLGLAGLATPAAAGDVKVPAPAMCFIVFQQTVGPVTVSDSCDGTVLEVDTSKLSSTQSHMQPAEGPVDLVKCLLDADSDVERFACVFGPPGP